MNTNHFIQAPLEQWERGQNWGWITDLYLISRKISVSDWLIEATPPGRHVTTRNNHSTNAVFRLFMYVFLSCDQFARKCMHVQLWTAQIVSSKDGDEPFTHKYRPIYNGKNRNPKNLGFLLYTLPEKPITFGVFGTKSTCAKKPESHTDVLVSGAQLLSTFDRTRVVRITSRAAVGCSRWRSCITWPKTRIIPLERAFTLAVKFRRSFKKSRCGGGFFDSLATFNEKPECEKDSGFLML